MIRAAFRAPSPLRLPSPSVCSLLSGVRPNHPEQLGASSKAWLQVFVCDTAPQTRKEIRVKGCLLMRSDARAPLVITLFPWLSATLSPRAGFDEGKNTEWEPGAPGPWAAGLQLINEGSSLPRSSWVLSCSCHVPGPVEGRCWGPPAGPSRELILMRGAFAGLRGAL